MPAPPLSVTPSGFSIPNNYSQYVRADVQLTTNPLNGDTWSLRGDGALYDNTLTAFSLVDKVNLVPTPRAL